MQRFKNILLVYDGTEQGKTTLNRAVDLATRNQARLTVIDVIEEIPRDYQMLITALLPQEIMELAVKEQNERLEHYITPIRETGCKVNAKVLVGKEFIEIISEVLRSRHDLVIKTARGKSGVKDILFGSTAMHLMRKCPCPVWVMKPEPVQSYKRILAAVDVTSTDAEENALNVKIMELATSLAHLEQSELHIVHVCDIDTSIFRKGRVDISPETIEKLASNAHGLHKTRFNDFLKKYSLDNVRHQAHLLEGEVSVLIPGFAKKRRINLIVMGTLCHTGISGFFMGSTAEKILHRVDCSVLTVKPEGFISPVTIDEK